MYRLGLGLGFVWGLRLQISLIYEFINIYIYMGFKHFIYIAVNLKRYTGIDWYSKYIVPLPKPV